MSATWVWALAINCSPFMRFDGYYLLSDAVGIPNLHERSFELARRALRGAFFGIDAPDPEPTLSARAKRALVVFAVVTWLYRLALFLGIAALVYAYFFKLLGAFLMAVEIGWFVVRPFAVEARALWGMREKWRARPRAWAAVACVAFVAAWLGPMSADVSVPAMARARAEGAAHAPFAARVSRVLVSEGQAVRAGDPLAALESPDLSARQARARLRGDGALSQMRASAVDERKLERLDVSSQQREEARADEDGAGAELDALTVRSPVDGLVRDMAADLAPGRWVGPRMLLMRVAGPSESEVWAFVPESEISAVKVGARARFYPDEPSRPPAGGRVESIDRAPGKTIAHPLLSSAHGGALAAQGKAGREAMVAKEAVYRVRVRLDPGEPAYPSTARGQARIDAERGASAWAGLARALSVLVREAGF